MADISVKATRHVEGAGKTAVITKLETPLAASFTYNYGANLDEAVGIFGAEVVFSLFTRGADIALQNVARTKMEKGESVESIQSFLNSYKLGVAAPRAAAVPPTAESLLAKVAMLTPEQMAEFIAKLKANRK